MTQELLRGKDVHKSHSLKVTGGLVWCCRCASYAQSRFKALKAKCSGPQAAGSKAGQLGRLRKGLHPLTGQPIGMPEERRAVARADPKLSVRSPRKVATGDASAMVLALGKPAYRVLGNALGRWLTC